MIDRCIHGFETQSCASCRRCAHALLESRCAVCGPPKSSRQASLMLASERPRPSEEHRGYEILYVPNERSWYIKADADAPRSRISFGSSFQARRAIDAILDAPPPRVSGQKNKG